MVVEILEPLLQYLEPIDAVLIAGGLYLYQRLLTLNDRLDKQRQSLYGVSDDPFHNGVLDILRETQTQVGVLQERMEVMNKNQERMINHLNEINGIETTMIEGRPGPSEPDSEQK